MSLYRRRIRKGVELMTFLRESNGNKHEDTGHMREENGSGVKISTLVVSLRDLIENVLAHMDSV